MELQQNEKLILQENFKLYPDNSNGIVKLTNKRLIFESSIQTKSIGFENLNVINYEVIKNGVLIIILGVMSIVLPTFTIWFCCSELYTLTVISLILSNILLLYWIFFLFIPNETIQKYLPIKNYEIEFKSKSTNTTEITLFIKPSEKEKLDNFLKKYNELIFNQP